MRKVNNFAAAGNEGLCPAEDFQIEWRLVYAAGEICPSKSICIHICQKKMGTQILNCPHMFRRVWGIGLEAK